MLLIPRQWQVRVLCTLVLALLASGQAFAQEARKPDLYLLAIGCSDFEKCKQLCGANDAEAFAACFQQQEGICFNKVHVTLLTNQQATGVNIRATLEEIRKRARPGDFVIVTVASHGGVDVLGRYYFTPYDYDPLRHEQTAVFGKDLYGVLNSLPCTRLLFLDTCHAGGAIARVQPGPVNAPSLWQEAPGQDSDTITLAACQSYQVSGEDGPNSTVPRRHGFASRAFLEALAGKADLNQDGTVTLEEIGQYMTRRIDELAGKGQVLRIHRPGSIRRDLPVVLLPQQQLSSSTNHQ